MTYFIPLLSLPPLLEVFQSVFLKAALHNQWTSGVDPKYPLEIQPPQLHDPVWRIIEAFRGNTIFI